MNLLRNLAEFVVHLLLWLFTGSSNLAGHSRAGALRV